MATKKQAPPLKCPECALVTGGSDYCSNPACIRSVWPIWVPTADLEQNTLVSDAQKKHGLVFNGLRWVRKPTIFTSTLPKYPSQYEQDEELAEAVRQDEFDNVTADIRQDIADAVAAGKKVVAELRGEISALNKRVLELQNPLIRVKLGPPVPAFGVPYPTHAVAPPPHTHAQCAGRVTSGFKLPRNHGKYWTWGDDQWLKKAYVAGVTLGYICAHLGRTPFAIFMRLVKLELVNENNVFTLWEEGVDTYSRGQYV